MLVYENEKGEVSARDEFNPAHETRIGRFAAGIHSKLISLVVGKRSVVMNVILCIEEKDADDPAITGVYASKYLLCDSVKFGKYDRAMITIASNPPWYPNGARPANAKEPT